MKGFRALACVLLISLPVLGYSGTLVVSQDLALEYPELELISHSSNMLILKYDDWVLSHQVVDGESMHSQVDLIGVTGEFIQSICISEKRSHMAALGGGLNRLAPVFVGAPTQNNLGAFSIASMLRAGAQSIACLN